MGDALQAYPFNSCDLRNNDAFSAGTETANTDIRFLKASQSRVCRDMSRWTGGRVSSVFWCLFDDDILVPTRRFEKGRVVRGEIKDRDKAGGSAGRVRSLVILSHRIGVTEQKSTRKLRLPRSPRVNLSWFHSTTG